MEISETVLALDFVDSKLDFAKGLLFILIQISEGNFDNPSLEGVIRIFYPDYKSKFCVGKAGDVLNPTERLTNVFPTFLTSNIEGALMSYQSDKLSGIDFVFNR